ncbi:MAG: aminotransferase class III-fold pyridoxal phosphate-dependent enzyme, partial [Beijerinckiaceae bacterium]
MSAAIAITNIQHAKPDLITLEEAKGMKPDAMRKLWAEHINPGQLHFLKLLGFDKIAVKAAEGPWIIDQNDRKILDFFGGFGSVAFGHNHPRIV